MEIIDLPLLAQLHKNVLVKVLKGVFYFVRARQGVPRTTLLQRALVHVLWFDVEQREDKNNKNKNKGIAERCVSTQLVTLAFFLTVGGDLQSWAIRGRELAVLTLKSTVVELGGALWALEHLSP